MPKAVRAKEEFPPDVSPAAPEEMHSGGQKYPITQPRTFRGRGA